MFSKILFILEVELGSYSACGGGTGYVMLNILE
jgi:hypothetical protein